MEEYTKELLDYGLYKSVRRSRRYKGIENKWDLWGEWHHNGHDDIHKFYMLLDKFLEKNIGRPYDKVYGEFCAKWPAIYCGDIDTRDAIRESCIPGSRSQYNYNKYMVDDNGNLKKNPNNYWNNHHKEKYKTIGYNGKTEYHYEFNKKLLAYSDIDLYITKRIGYNNMLDLKESEYIPSKILNILYNYYDWRFIEQHKHYRECGSWIFHKIEINYDPIIIKRGTKEYKRYCAEATKQSKIIRREHKKATEEYNSNLLHNIEAKKKEKELQQNIVDRDRLGFDNNSFIGEPYHGQKRKKK